MGISVEVPGFDLQFKVASGHYLDASDYPRTFMAYHGDIRVSMSVWIVDLRKPTLKIIRYVTVSKYMAMMQFTLRSRTL